MSNNNTEHNSVKRQVVAQPAPKKLVADNSSDYGSFDSDNEKINALNPKAAAEEAIIELDKLISQPDPNKNASHVSVHKHTHPHTDAISTPTKPCANKHSNKAQLPLTMKKCAARSINLIELMELIELAYLPGPINMHYLRPDADANHRKQAVRQGQRTGQSATTFSGQTGTYRTKRRE